MHFLNDGTLTAENAAITAYNLWIAGASKFWSSYSWAIETNVETIDVATGQVIGSTAVSPYTSVGSNGADPLPWQTQGLITLATGTYVAGRQVQGHIFLPGVCENDNTAGIPVSSYLTAWNGYIAAAVSDVLSELVVYSRTHHNYYPVTAGHTSPKWAVLRSRRD